MNLLNYLQNNMNKGKCIRGLMLDYKKVFDVIHLSTMLKKLEDVGIVNGA